MNMRLDQIIDNTRMWDCVNYLLKVLAWFCSSCKSGGVIRCGLKPSQRFTTRAIREHIESDTHYKHAPEAIKALLDVCKAKKKRMRTSPT